jgi:quinol-cytochrome oxidoreductase complex cytochrome b subunit/mono/diheme cytochrome c family protein
MKKLIAWVDDRTGIKESLNEALYENIPSGARWRYVSGSMLVFAFVTQVITGLFLWMAYSASSQTAYESVYFIQYEMTGGWLLRGVHHFMAQAMVVLLGVHLLQVIVDGAYKSPREFNYWLGIILMQLVLGLGLTGYLLPWDQKGFWATNVATNLMTLVPFVGKEVQQLALGGGEYGHHTLTRFFAMHAGVLPAMLVGFLGLHLALFRRHGIKAKITSGRADSYFFPNQVLYDGLACMALLIVVLMFAWRGAELGAPADPSEQYAAARPEWYFLFLFQLLKYFTEDMGGEFMGAIVVPGILMTILAAAPVIAWFRGGHIFNVAYVLVLLVGAGALTGVAMYEDSQNADFIAAKEQAEHDAHRVRELFDRRSYDEKTGELSERQMADARGLVHVFRNDPLTQGPRLFQRHCNSCHAYTGEGSQWQFPVLQDPVKKTIAEGKEGIEVVDLKNGKAAYDETPLTAPNLYGFATREWIAGMLNPEEIAATSVRAENKPKKDSQDPRDFRRVIESPYFGNTAHKDGRMVTWVKKHLGSKSQSWTLADGETKFDGQIVAVADGDDPVLTFKTEDDKEKQLKISALAETSQKKAKKDAQQQKDTGAIVKALSAQARLRNQAESDIADQAEIARGVQLIQSTCAQGCHKFGDVGQIGLAPDLTGYGSFEWTMGMIANPAHERYYGNENDRMPAFAAHLQDLTQNKATAQELALIVDWLRGDYYLKDDEKPVLPHVKEEAVLAVNSALAEPANIVGLAPSKLTPELQAEQLFAENCAACHNHLNEKGQGIASANPSAPNLYGFGSKEWLRGLLDPERIGTAEYFGNTAHKDGEMVRFVSENLSDLTEEQQTQLDNIIAMLSSRAGLPSQTDSDKQAGADGMIEKGKEGFETAFEFESCADCHSYAGDGVPDLAGWGSKDWLKEFIANPAEDKFYGESNDRMPAFRNKAEAHRNLLSDEELDLVVRWLRGEEL